MNYSEFCQKLSEDVADRYLLVLDYDDFQVWQDTYTNKYFYLEVSENDASDFFEVKVIARLIYDVNNDIKIPADETGRVMSELFDCCCCGEFVADNCIKYLWFDEVNKSGI